MAYTGPFITDKYNGTNHWRTQHLYRSTGPRSSRTVIPYTISDRRANGFWNIIGLDNVMSVRAVEVSELYARTYDKFWQRVHKRANLALTLMDRKKSLTMISTRVGQLLRFTNYLRKGKVLRAAAVLGLRPSDPRVTRAKRNLRDTKDIANGWLEFTFGWVPLVSDIGSAVDVLQRDFDIHRVKARTSTSFNNHYPWDGGASHSLMTQGHYNIGAYVRITNPNLLLANELGFTNPAYVAWDAIPFSFVVDWFIPVGKFLSSFSNDIGLQMLQEYRQWGLSTNGVINNVTNGESSARGYASVRTVGPLPRPDLMSRFRFPKVDPWLAATSVSLLIQQLTTSKRS